MSHIAPSNRAAIYSIKMQLYSIETLKQAALPRETFKTILNL